MDFHFKGCSQRHCVLRLDGLVGGLCIVAQVAGGEIIIYYLYAVDNVVANEGMNCSGRDAAVEHGNADMFLYTV